MDTTLTGQRFIANNNQVTTPNNSKYDSLEFSVDVPPVLVSVLNILPKKYSFKLSGLNDYMAEFIANNFLIHYDLGWQHAMDRTECATSS